MTHCARCGALIAGNAKIRRMPVGSSRANGTTATHYQDAFLHPKCAAALDEARRQVDKERQDWISVVVLIAMAVYFSLLLYAYLRPTPPPPPPVQVPTFVPKPPRPAYPDHSRH
jgi:hypothetical protein